MDFFRKITKSGWTSTEQNSDEKQNEVPAENRSSKRKRVEASPPKNFKVIKADEEAKQKQDKRKGANKRRSKSTLVVEVSDSDSDAQRRWSENLEEKKRRFLTVSKKIIYLNIN